MNLDEAIKRAAHYRNQLIFLWGDQSACSSKLEQFATESGLSVQNLNLELSALLLEEPAQDRKRISVTIAEDWLRKTGSTPLLLNHIEFLFDTALGLDPVKVMLNSSKNKAIVAIWPGVMVANQLTYATPGHHEYKSYKLSELGEAILLHVSGD